MSETVTVKWVENNIPVIVLARLMRLAPIALRTLCSGPWNPERISLNVVSSEKAFRSLQERGWGQTQLRIRESEKTIAFQFLSNSKPELVISDIPDDVLSMIIHSVSH